MTAEQMFFATAGLMVTLFVAALGFFKYYLDAKFDGVNVKFDGVDAKFDRVDAKFDAVNAKFDGVDAQFGGVDAQFGGVDAQFGGVNAKFDGVNAKFEGIYKILERLDRRDESLTAYMIDHAERISKLEARLTWRLLAHLVPVQTWKSSRFPRGHNPKR